MSPFPMGSEKELVKLLVIDEPALSDFIRGRAVLDALDYRRPEFLVDLRDPEPRPQRVEAVLTHDSFILSVLQIGKFHYGSREVMLRHAQHLLGLGSAAWSRRKRRREASLAHAEFLTKQVWSDMEPPPKLMPDMIICHPEYEADARRILDADQRQGMIEQMARWVERED